MRLIPVTSFLLAFACTLALVACQHTASNTTQSNQRAASQAHSASAQADPADVPGLSPQCKGPELHGYADTLTVGRLDTLARSVRNLIAIMEDVNSAACISVRSPRT
jgi:hypothetical protein